MDTAVRIKIRKLLKSPFARIGASGESLKALMTELGHHLPDEYLDFMRETNGYHGEVGSLGFVNIWPVEEVMPTNQANQFREWIPGLVLFASNDSGDFYAFDMRRSAPTVVFVPSITLRMEGVVECGSSFIGFLERLAQSS